MKRLFRIFAEVDALHCATAPTSIKPTEVPPTTYGHHKSYVYVNDYVRRRKWGFETAAQRDRFVSDYWDEGARIA